MHKIIEVRTQGYSIYDGANRYAPVCSCGWTIRMSPYKTVEAAVEAARAHIVSNTTGEHFPAFNGFMPGWSPIA